MRVLCFTFNNTFVAYDYTLVRSFENVYTLEIVFTQPGPGADIYKRWWLKLRPENSRVSGSIDSPILGLGLKPSLRLH